MAARAAGRTLLSPGRTPTGYTSTLFLRSPRPCARTDFPLSSTIPSPQPPAGATPSILRNYLILAVANLVAQGLTFALLIVVARRFGQGALGQLSVAQNVALYFKLIADAGLEVLGSQRVAAAAHSGSVRDVVGAILGVRIVNATVLVGLIALYAWLGPAGSTTTTLAIICSLAILPFAILLEWAFVGLQAMPIVAASRVMSAAATLALVILLASNSEHLPWVGVAIVSGTTLSSSLLFLQFSRRVGRIKLRVAPAMWTATMRASLPLGASFLLIQMYYALPILMLGHFSTSDRVGQYAAAQKMVLFVTALSALLGTAVLPRLAALWQADRARFDQFVQILVDGCIALSVPLGVGGMLVAPPLVELLYGSGFDEAGRLLRILVWMGFTVLANVPFAYVLLASERRRAYFRCVAAGACTSVVLNAILIPAFGPWGAAFGTLGPEVLVLGLLMWEASRVTRYHVGRPLAMALVASIAMAAVLWAARGLPVALMVGSGALVYLITYAMLSRPRLPDYRAYLTRRIP